MTTHYTTGEEVYKLLLDLQVGVNRLQPTDIEPFIQGLESQVDGVLRGQDYPTVPATGTNDIAMIREMVRKKAAAQVYVTLNQPIRSPDWVRTYDIDFADWLKSLRKGELRLVDQDPQGEDLPFFAVVRHPTRDDLFTERGGQTDWDES